MMGCIVYMHCTCAMHAMYGMLCMCASVMFICRMDVVKHINDEHTKTFDTSVV